MSLSQFGYSPTYSTNSSPLVSTQILPPTSSSSPSSPPSMANPCCEKGVPLTNPHTGQTMCSCQCTSAGLLPYPRLPLPDPATYSNSPYGAPPQGYGPLAADPSAFYPPLTSPYDLKEAGETWRGLGQTSPCYPYDTSPMGPYHYPNSYGGVDINSAARRKNATRENTNTLKAWLYEHRKNPYPTKGEKIMLAIITKMTLTQVSTWFANARRRLKKENKMTWSPRNKPGENDDDDDKAKSANGDSDDDEEEGGGGGGCGGVKSQDSPPHPKGGPDRDGRSLTETPPDCSGARGGTHTTMQVYDPPSEVQRTTPFESHSLASRHGAMSRGAPASYVHHHLGTADGQPTFLNVPKGLKGYQHNQPQASSGGLRGSVTSQDMPMEKSAPLMTRPDSMCSNSNDSGLSDVTCGYSDGVMDGLRPKIWSLAHVATSEVGYMNHCSGGINTTSGTICMEKNCNGSGMVGVHAPGFLAGSGPDHGGRLQALGPSVMNGVLDTPTSSLPSYSSNTHSSMASSSSSSPSSPPISSTSSLTSLLPPAMGPPQHAWPPMYGNNNNINNNNNNVSCMGNFNGGAKPGPAVPNLVFSQTPSSMVGGMTSLPPLPSPHGRLQANNAGSNVAVPSLSLAAAAAPVSSLATSALFPQSSSPAFSHMTPTTHANYFTPKTSGLE